MDRGAWQAAVHGVAQSQTRLSDFTFTFHFHALEKEMATLPGESQGQGSLVGCRLWGRTESDTTEATQQQQQHFQFYKRENNISLSFIYLSCCFEECHLFAINLFTDMVVFKLSISLFVLYYNFPPILSFFQFLILPYFGLIIFYSIFFSIIKIIKYYFVLFYWLSQRL